MEFNTRKVNRLQEYDYSSPNSYFITVCTQNRELVFGSSFAETESGTRLILSPAGKMLEEAVMTITKKYPAIEVANYVIMPNHVHLLLDISADEGGRAMHAPTISLVVQQMKGYVSKAAGRKLWQKGFYDHVVRGKEDRLKIWEYIDNNPAKWHEDELYT